MNYFCFLLVVLSSVGFFNYHGILSAPMQKAIFYLCIGATFVYSIVKCRSTSAVEFPRKPYILLMCCFVISAFMASAFHNQDLTTSLIATLPAIFSYGFLYILLRLDIPEQKIIKAFYVLLGCSTIVYFCNAATFPQNIFGEPMLNQDMSRGILRIKVVFIEFFPLLLFYAINRWNLTSNKKWFLLMAWMTLMIVLSVVRQCILFSGVLGFFFIFYKLSTIKKVLLISAFVGIVLVVLPMIPMYQTMMEFSQDQAESNEDVEDIRIQSWRNYTYENQTNLLTPILGNGMPSYGNSQWGTMMEGSNEMTGMFAEDVGWAGFFWYYGAIATACLIVLLLKAFKRKKRPDQQYLNYWIIYLAITTVASGPILYYYKVILLMIVLYICFNCTPNEEAEAEADSDQHSSLDNEKARMATSWLPKLPQLKK